ncbi:MAG TPA: serine/threonine-protein kinase [Kofleriaceae bacterium]|jgi:serine/threonine protein kinase
MSNIDYSIGDLVGQGGMGTVHQARRGDGSQRYALKQLRSDLVTDSAMRSRFAHEQRILALLDHPSIPRLVDDGETSSGIPYFVSTWCEGEPLSELIARRGSLAFDETLAIIEQLVNALAHAHRRGIVHGDVKPDNILVSCVGDRPRVSLVDWGIARAFEEPAEQGGMVSGTPGYLAPEVLRGGLPGVAADTYGVGAVLYEMLTGAPPFGQGNSTAVFQRQLQGEVLPPSLKNANIPTRVEDVICKALATDAASRYQSVEQLLGALISLPTTFAKGSTTMPRVTTAELSDCPTRDWRPRRSSPREALPESALSPNVDERSVAIAALDVAEQFILRNRLADAATKLEAVVDRLHDSRDIAPVLLSLAAIYAGMKRRADALRVARLAETHSERIDDHAGCQRARQFLKTLGIAPTRLGDPARR